jgi:photosystem II biogenesis protein Psp29
VNNLPTVSDTKRAFYGAHTRPINSIYRRVVEELMVEMHLLNVNSTFSYNAIYALGVVTTFDRFMDTYDPPTDRDSIFASLCQALQSDGGSYRRDAAQAQEAVAGKSIDNISAWLAGQDLDGAGSLKSAIETITGQPTFKYSRLFGIGLLTLLDEAEGNLPSGETLTAMLAPIATALHLPAEKLQKDIESYRSNLDRMVQTQLVMKEALEADRKKREQRAQDKIAKDAADKEAADKKAAADKVLS